MSGYAGPGAVGEPATQPFQQFVGEWAQRTFPQSTPLTVVAHLRREVEELAQCVTQGERGPGGILVADIATEAADCALLLLHLAHKLDFDLFAAMLGKHSENQGRRWGPPDAEGVSEHER